MYWCRQVPSVADIRPLKTCSKMSFWSLLKKDSRSLPGMLAAERCMWGCILKQDISSTNDTMHYSYTSCSLISHNGTIKRSDLSPRAFISTVDFSPVLYLTPDLYPTVKWSLPQAASENPRPGLYLAYVETFTVVWHFILRVQTQSLLDSDWFDQFTQCTNYALD